MHGDHVGTLVEERLSGVTFNGRVEPGTGPNNLNEHVGVGGLCAQGEGVNAANYFRDGESGNVTKQVAFGHCAGHHAGEITRFVHASERVTEVRIVVFVTRHVFEDNVGVFLG